MKPFDHWVIDDFLPVDTAIQLSNEFMDYNNPSWFCYNNPLEKKKSCNDWYLFPPKTYEVISYFCSEKFISNIKSLTGIENLYPDIGLHGAGWHITGRGGKLNVHLDYSIHPKLNKQRKLNLIVYLTEDWNTDWGGNLQFWSNDKENNKPESCKKIVDNIFNRAVIFDTTQNSWHGYPEPINCPEGVYRKSIAVYYLTDPPEDVDSRKRALYYPTKEQENNLYILNFIKLRCI